MVSQAALFNRHSGHAVAHFNIETFLILLLSSSPTLLPYAEL